MPRGSEGGGGGGAELSLVEVMQVLSDSIKCARRVLVCSRPFSMRANVALTSLSQICRFSKSGMYETSTQVLKFRGGLLVGFVVGFAELAAVLPVSISAIVVVVVVVLVVFISSSPTSFTCMSSKGIVRSRNS